MLTALLVCSEQRGQRPAHSARRVLFRGLGAAPSGPRPGAGGGGGPHQNVPQKTQAPTGVPFQRHPRVRKHHHEQEKGSTLL